MLQVPSLKPTSSNAALRPPFNSGLWTPDSGLPLGNLLTVYYVL